MSDSSEKEVRRYLRDRKGRIDAKVHRTTRRHFIQSAGAALGAALEAVKTAPHVVPPAGDKLLQLLHDERSDNSKRLGREFAEVTLSYPELGSLSVFDEGTLVTSTGSVRWFNFVKDSVFDTQKAHQIYDYLAEIARRKLAFNVGGVRFVFDLLTGVERHLYLIPQDAPSPFWSKGKGRFIAATNIFHGKNEPPTHTASYVRNNFENKGAAFSLFSRGDIASHFFVVEAAQSVFETRLTANDYDTFLWGQEGFANSVGWLHSLKERGYSYDQYLAFMSTLDADIEISGKKYLLPVFRLPPEIYANWPKTGNILVQK